LLLTNNQPFFINTMNKDRLKEIILGQKEVFSVKSGLIERDIPLETYIKTSQIVVITGVRRCGKSSLLLHTVIPVFLFEEI